MGVFSSSGLFGNQDLASIRLSNYFNVDLRNTESCASHFVVFPVFVSRAKPKINCNSLFDDDRDTFEQDIGIGQLYPDKYIESRSTFLISWHSDPIIRNRNSVRIGSPR